MPARTRPTTPARRSPSRRRAFTLIEVLIALVLLLAIAALVLPTLAGAGRDSAIRDVREQLSAATMVARAEARRRGGVVELVVVDRQLLIRLVERGVARTVDDLGGVPDVLDFDLAALASAADPSAVDSIDQSPDAPSQGDRTPVVVLARFWPDGHSELVHAWAIQVRDAYVLRPRINTWTGVLVFEERAIDADRDPADEPVDEPLDEPPSLEQPIPDAPPEPDPPSARGPARGGA